MALLEKLSEKYRTHLEKLQCPEFESTPWQPAPPLSSCRIAIVSTAGLQIRGDRPFTLSSIDYRIIPDNANSNDIVMSHVSTNFDRTGFQQDLNTIFPIDRLHELERAGIIGSVAKYHYSFMGATEPLKMKETVHFLVDLLKKDKVSAVLLVPV